MRMATTHASVLTGDDDDDDDELFDFTVTILWIQNAVRAIACYVSTE